MKIPSKQQCYTLMCEMKMLDHIVIHSLQVCRVAVFLANQLKDQNIFLNSQLIQAAALLHDITKTRSFKTDENHAITGAQFLIEQGYPDVANLVRQHVRLDHYVRPVTLGEAQVVNYADKRVLHDKVVTLDKRLTYILERYAKEPEHRKKIRWLWERTRALEDRIFGSLTIFPEDLSHILNCENRRIDFDEYKRVCERRL